MDPTSVSPEMTDHASFVAWTVAITSLIGAIFAGLGVLAGRYWKEGTKAKIDIMNAEARLLDARAKADAVNAENITRGYEAAMTEMKLEFDKKLLASDADCKADLGKMQAHIDIIDKKLDASEDRNRKAESEAATFKAKFEILQQQYTLVCNHLTTLKPGTPQ